MERVGDGYNQSGDNGDELSRQQTRDDVFKVKLSLGLL